MLSYSVNLYPVSLWNSSDIVWMPMKHRSSGEQRNLLTTGGKKAGFKVKSTTIGTSAFQCSPYISDGTAAFFWTAGVSICELSCRGFWQRYVNLWESEGTVCFIPGRRAGHTGNVLSG